MVRAIDAASGLPGAAQQLASAVASALVGGDDRVDAWDPSQNAPDAPLTVAAVRVLGADVLAPVTMAGRPAVVDTATAERACTEYAPGPDASPVTAWSHWGLREALRRMPGAAGTSSAAGTSAVQPGTGWVRTEPWPQLTHRLAQLASLAVPVVDSALRTAVAERPVDLARGFVRAIRRRDWLQAAGAGRWLALTPGVPETTGLAAGLEFVQQMGGDDARVLLQTRAARLVLTGARA